MGRPCLPSPSTYTSFKLTQETSRFTMSRTPSALQASDNFEPSSEWVHEEAFITLLVHLPGFKREQIKVQISNTGHINISGERPLEGQRRSKFIKQYPLPEHCKVAETRAKFENEVLQIRFSIAQDEVTRPLVPTPTMHKSPSSPMERTTTQQGEKEQERNGKSQKAVPEEEELRRKQEQPKAKEEIGRDEQPKATESSSFPGSNGKGAEMTAKYSINSLFMDFRPDKKTLLVNVAVAGLVFLAIGLYLRYK